MNLFGPPEPHGGAHPPFDIFRSFSPGHQGPPPNGFRNPFGPIRFDPIRYEGDDGDWRIVVRHHKGSIAAAVAELRYRNLALSFGVLLVLAGSVALIIFNSTRAHRLAKLQMDFVAGVSHELRTPVAAILSMSDNIASGVVSDKQQFVAYGDLIRHQARQLSHLVEQVLYFSARNKKANNYRFRPVQISDIVTEALENTAVLISNSEIDVQCMIDPDLPVVYADFSALSQCLQNLITNAVKYGKDGKWIGIHAAKDEAGSVPEVSITVEDHGIGIDPESLNHVFDPFYRSPRVAESEVHGTGLGFGSGQELYRGNGRQHHRQERTGQRSRIYHASADQRKAGRSRN